MHKSISQHADAFQLAFDFVELATIPASDLAEIGIAITPLPETQEWWSDLEYRHIPKKPGIYAIVNTKTGKFYIGSAASLYSRKGVHFHHLRKGEHANSHLQRSYDRHGADAFRFAIVERVSNKESLIEREQYYIDTLNPHYNIARTAGNTLGVKHSEETKAMLRELSKGHVPSEETRKKRSEAMKGKPSPNKGKPMPESTKVKISESLKGHPGHTKGKPHSEETKVKMSSAHKGRTSPNKGKTLSESHKANLSAVRKGKPKSEAHKAKISQSHKGKKKSPEAVAKRQATIVAKQEAGEYTPRKLSEETKAKISQAHRDKKREPFSDEWRKSLSEARKGNTYAKGYKHTEETKARLSESLKGRKREPFSEEHKAKISASKKRSNKEKSERLEP